MGNCKNWSGIDWIAAVLVLVGALNWGLVGAFGFDLVAFIFGSMPVVAQVVYVVVGLSALWMIFSCCKSCKS